MESNSEIVATSANEMTIIEESGNGIRDNEENDSQNDVIINTQYKEEVKVRELLIGSDGRPSDIFWL